MKGYYKKTDDFDVRYDSFLISLNDINDKNSEFFQERKIKGHQYDTAQKCVLIGRGHNLENTVEIGFYPESDLQSSIKNEILDLFRRYFE